MEKNIENIKFDAYMSLLKSFKGLINKDIALELGLEVQTIKNMRYGSNKVNQSTFSAIRQAHPIKGFDALFSDSQSTPGRKELGRVDVLLKVIQKLVGSDSIDSSPDYSVALTIEELAAKSPKDASLVIQDQSNSSWCMVGDIVRVSQSGAIDSIETGQMVVVVANSLPGGVAIGELYKIEETGATEYHIRQKSQAYGSTFLVSSSKVVSIYTIEEMIYETPRPNFSM